MEPASGTAAEAFTLVREIGRGGMGVVYLARDHKQGDLCAVKLLHQHLALDEIMVMRFQIEARVASAIEHPALVKMRGDISRLPGGQWYCMMEYVDGLTLAQLVAQMGPLPLAVILDVIAPLCDALDLAHAAKIIHRDLKPDNVMVVLRADAYDPKLLDFGIAKLLDEPPVTRPGATVGTVAYTAPEQARGEPATHRCDVYALGVMVYQMITGGHLPYDAADGALYHAQMTQRPIDPRKRHGGVPAAAVGPILAAIHADATQRPPTAGQFAVMLAGALVGTTPQTDGMSIIQRRAPRLLVGTNMSETLRAPGLTGTRGSAVTPWGYDYGEVLGRGGFGEVLRGTKRGAVGFAVPVAIKRIVPEYAKTPEFVEMFHQEARVAANLSNHPNVVKVIDHAIDPDGAPVIVMEFIDGVDLDKLRRSGPIPFGVIIFILCEMLEGLGHAHHLPPLGGSSSAEEIAARAAMLGIVHRDMSHHNVMVSRHGAVKVLDFGIAKLRDKTNADGSTMIKGKPAYLSPEQASSAKTIDCRADLFAVGVMLWELLTGDRLFERDTLQETLAAVMFGDIHPPRVFNDQVPIDLELVAMRLLEREPDQRFQTAQEAAAALSACAATSRTARTELQQLVRARFPQSVVVPADARASASGHQASRGRSPGGRRAHAGQTVTAPEHLRIGPAAPRRVLRLVAVGGIGAAIATFTVAFVASHRASDARTAPEHPASPSAPSGAPMAIPPSPPSAPTPATPAVASSPVAARISTTVVVETKPSDAAIRIKAATRLIAAGRSPLTISVPQGAQVQIRARLSGFEPLTQDITIGDQEHQTVTLELEPLAQPTPEPSRTSPAARPAAKTGRSPTKPKDSDDDQIIE